MQLGDLGNPPLMEEDLEERGLCGPPLHLPRRHYLQRGSGLCFRNDPARGEFD